MDLAKIMDVTESNQALAPKSSIEDPQNSLNNPQDPGIPQKQSAPIPPRWQILGERMRRSEHILDCSDVEAFLNLIPARDEKPLHTAFRISQKIGASVDKCPISEFLLLSLCSVLSISGGATSRELAQVFEGLTDNRRPKYWDELMRGARFANLLIIDWALRGRGSQRENIDRATQCVLHGTSTSYSLTYHS